MSPPREWIPLHRKYEMKSSHQNHRIKVPARGGGGGLSFVPLRSNKVKEIKRDKDTGESKGAAE